MQATDVNYTDCQQDPNVVKYFNTTRTSKTLQIHLIDNCLQNNLACGAGATGNK